MDFKEHLKKYLDESQIEKLCDSFNNKSEHAVLLNLRKMDEETFLSLFPHVTPHPFVKHAFIYDKDEYNLGKSIYHLLGCFYLQEPSAMIPAYLLNPNEDDILLDLCAAPGGKTVQSSFLMNNKGLIISNDISRNRCNALIENVERLGIGDVIITNNDFDKIKYRYKNTFTKIILDAPCSGSGMFRKDSKMFGDWSYNKVLKYSQIQKELILLAYSLLQDGGEMVYSTCSYSYEEDEEVIKYLLDNTDAEISPIPSDESLYQDSSLPLGVHTFPYLFSGEGHYICLIHKPNNSVAHQNKKEKKLTKLNQSVNFDKNLTYITKYGNTYFGLPSNPIELKDLNIVRLGVKIGEEDKDNFKYAYHYSHYIKSFKSEKSLSDSELSSYLHGETLPTNLARGYVLLKYKGVSLSFGKSDGNTIKNHFPKGLRK